MSENQAKFTVLFDDGGFQHNEEDQSEFADASLEQIIERSVRRWPRVVPIAWATEWPSYVKGVHDLRAESIAAGRLIEKVGDRYIARGVEEEKKTNRGAYYRSILENACLAGGLSGKRADKPAEPQRPRLTWADTKPVDRFPGFTVSSDTTPTEATHSHPLQVLGDLNAPGHGSALLKVR
jgi:hypothetical protein